MIKFNYILNDLALSSLITKCLYSENANYSDKEELENQIKLIQQENEKLQQENNQLREKLDKYENPEDTTLFAMWCTEKVKDENKKLQERVEYLERSNNRREDTILEQRQEIELLEHYKTLYQSLKKEKDEFTKYLEDESKEIYIDGGLRQNIFRQILQKNKSIIGDDK